MSDSGSVREALGRFPLFAGVPDEQLQWFVSRILHQRFKRGETIFSREDDGDRAFFILSGAVDLVIESPAARELFLARLQSGEHFGAMAVVDDAVRSAAARPAAPTELVVVLRETFMRALAEEP